MKYYVYLVVAILGLHGCSPKMHTESGEVNFLSKESQAVFLVKSMGYGKNRVEAVANAEKNAFRVLLFRGLPGSDVPLPLVENEAHTRSVHATYLRHFFAGNRYRSFLMSSKESSKLTKIPGGKRIAVDLKINHHSLRRDLEENQVIRKFGY
ncbi:hypothetical protein [Cyclobacterium xiamenense]|uniref:hypothetical protein n=1 Tax=Cyclobacterium xiamenense TaxID=1297121 RepID=UPI0012BA2C19|nr:hypothetical protein [Cyclobacterium xiamenense]